MMANPGSAERVRSAATAAALLMVLSACGSEDLAGPAAPPSVAGSWTYAAERLQATFLGGPVTCDYDLLMQIPETGPTFTGFYSNAQLVCTLSGTPQLVEFGGGTVVAGKLERDSVHFDFDAATIHNAGTIDGDRMNGWVEIELVIQVDSDVDTVLVTGGWTATR